MRADRTRGKVKVGGMNAMVAGIDLGDRESLRFSLRSEMSLS
jgi:hypothetical protein